MWFFFKFLWPTLFSSTVQDFDLITRFLLMDTSVLHQHWDQVLCNMYEVASSPAHRQSSFSLRRIRCHLTSKRINALRSQIIII
jgi:hypothetical protein